MFFKHFANKNQRPGFYISGTLVENGLIKYYISLDLSTLNLPWFWQQFCYNSNDLVVIDWFLRLSILSCLGNWKTRAVALLCIICIILYCCYILYYFRKSSNPKCSSTNSHKKIKLDKLDDDDVEMEDQNATDHNSSQDSSQANTSSESRCFLSSLRYQFEVK